MYWASWGQLWEIYSPVCSRHKVPRMHLKQTLDCGLTGHVATCVKLLKVVSQVMSRMMAFLISRGLLMGHDQCHKHSEQTSHMKMRRVCYGCSVLNLSKVKLPMEVTHHWRCSSWQSVEGRRAVWGTQLSSQNMLIVTEKLFFHIIHSQL